MADKRLIDANALVYQLLCLGEHKSLPVLTVSQIEKAPTVDAVPVVHGEWVDNGIPDSMLSGCSVCGFSCGAYSFNYCPNCGAKMDGGVEDGG